MAHAQKPDFVLRRNGRVHFNRRGRQFSRLLAAELCASAVVMLDKSCSEVVWRVLTPHSIRQFPLHFPSHASPCAITFQLDSNTNPLYAYHTAPELALSDQSYSRYYSVPTAEYATIFQWQPLTITHSLSSSCHIECHMKTAFSVWNMCRVTDGYPFTVTCSYVWRSSIK